MKSVFQTMGSNLLNLANIFSSAPAPSSQTVSQSSADISLANRNFLNLTNLANILLGNVYAATTLSSDDKAAVKTFLKTLVDQPTEEVIFESLSQTSLIRLLIQLNPKHKEALNEQSFLSKLLMVLALSDKDRTRALLKNSEPLNQNNYLVKGNHEAWKERNNALHVACVHDISVEDFKFMAGVFGDGLIDALNEKVTSQYKDTGSIYNDNVFELAARNNSALIPCLLQYLPADHATTQGTLWKIYKAMQDTGYINGVDFEDAFESEHKRFAVLLMSVMCEINFPIERLHNLIQKPIYFELLIKFLSPGKWGLLLASEREKYSKSNERVLQQRMASTDQTRSILVKVTANEAKSLHPCSVAIALSGPAQVLLKNLNSYVLNSIKVLAVKDQISNFLLSLTMVFSDQEIFQTLGQSIDGIPLIQWLTTLEKNCSGIFSRYPADLPDGTNSFLPELKKALMRSDETGTRKLLETQNTVSNQDAPGLPPRSSASPG